MTYEEIVYKVQKQVIKSKTKADQHIAVQFNIVGEGEGAFYIEIDDGRISVQPYEYYDRDAVVYVDAETLFDVLEQKIAIADVPEEIWKDLNGCEPIKGWVYWFFNMTDNISMTPEKIEQKKMSYPPGTKIYKNKILGLRGKATGLVFSNFCNRHIITRDQAKSYIRREVDEMQGEYFIIFTSGLDTAYSTKSPDTIAMSFMGITNKGKLIVLDEKVYNNAELDIPIAPSDTVRNYIDFLERNRKEWGGMSKNVFIDNADQATITEFAKYKREHIDCQYIFNNAYKKVTIIDRINLQLGWMSFNDEKGREPSFYIVDTCTNYKTELETYSWLEDKDCEPEDGNDHMVNSVQYGWIPYRSRIGIENKK